SSGSCSRACATRAAAVARIADSPSSASSTFTPRTSSGHPEHAIRGGSGVRSPIDPYLKRPPPHIPCPAPIPNPTRTHSSGRDLRSLLHVPQHDLQAQVASRLERLGFPALRPVHVQLLSAISSDGVRLAELVTAVSLPKQTVGDLIDDLEGMRMVERFPDP